MRVLLILLALLLAHPAGAQTFPPLSGRVVDAADLLQPDQEAALDAKLAGLESATSRQLVVATVPDMQGYPIEDYANGLFRAWQLGQRNANNGALLLVAVGERRVRIEVGYGLEGILTDALSSRIVRDDITPRFRNGDFPGGIEAGTDAIIAQLQAPPEVAEQRAMDAAQAERASDDGSGWPLIFWIIVIFFIVIPMLRSGFGGKRYRGGRGPIVIWGPGLGGSDWGGSGSGSSWSSGGSSWGGGGFSGGGGSSGGGGASGGW
ncbi:TPM domain-containing protein [Sphingosinicella sp. LHD-64]|uniref:TPM domain-containing protein n=1 Tax=Sphingosinicella sp. LHD-64 TaxID=3072139 RepID=UPI0028102102|nr:TPM domain-containing protein [Sphingosinicella sp. LHD-64]MDQ8758292.1 TPM domain-containing protein [Sphingosinicella sp. LHD-64]